MKQVARALVHQRMSYPALRTAGITFRADIDPEAAEKTWPLSLIHVDIQASDVFAVVPFTVRETVYGPPEEDLDAMTTHPMPHQPGRGIGDVVDLIVRTISGKAWFGKDAAIHRQSFAGLAYEADAGGMFRAVITWTGEASWVLNRGGGR